MNTPDVHSGPLPTDRPSLIFYGVLAAALCLFPLVFGFDAPTVNIALFVIIYIVLALGLNIVVGFTGLLDLGYVSFMAVGAVFAAQCLLFTVTPEGDWVFPVGTTEIPEGSHPLVFAGSYVFILLGAGLVCALIGVLRGIPTLRLSGDYYAIVTLGFAEIIFLILFNEEWLSGGAFGMKLTSSTRPYFTSADSVLYWDNWQFYVFMATVLIATIVGNYCLQHSRLGRAWAAIRLDPTAAQASGVNITWAKMVGFAVSGFIGGVGGGLYALWAGTIAVRSLEVWQSILILCCIVMGGMASIRGVIIGAIVLMTFGELLRRDVPFVGPLPEARWLFFGILIIILMRFRPQGLIPLAPRQLSVPPETLEAIRQAPNPLFTLKAADAPAPEGTA